MSMSVAKIYYLEGIKECSPVKKCVFCNRTENLQYFRNHILCTDCLISIRKLHSSGYFQQEKFTICKNL